MLVIALTTGRVGGCMGRLRGEYLPATSQSTTTIPSTHRRRGGGPESNKTALDGRETFPVLIYQYLPAAAYLRVLILKAIIPASTRSSPEYGRRWSTVQCRQW